MCFGIELESEVSIQAIETWIDGIELKGFLEDLKCLKETLKGRALLESESPGEFLLEIKPVDEKGHFILTIELGKSKYIHSCHSWAKVQNAFPLAAQELETVGNKIINYLEAELNA